MFIQQEFLKSYKNKVTNMYFKQVDLNDINFLQAYFANKFQLEVNQEVEAFDEEEARDTVEDEYRLQKIILTADDFEYVEFNNL